MSEGFNSSGAESPVEQHTDIDEAMAEQRNVEHIENSVDATEKINAQVEAMIIGNIDPAALEQARQKTLAAADAAIEKAVQVKERLTHYETRNLLAKLANQHTASRGD